MYYEPSQEWLVPVDGTPASAAAVEYVIANADSARIHVHLLNVQRPIMTGDVSVLASARLVADLRRSTGEQALRAARTRLNRHFFRVTCEVVFGDAGRSDRSQCRGTRVCQDPHELPRGRLCRKHHRSIDSQSHRQAFEDPCNHRQAAERTNGCKQFAGNGCAPPVQRMRLTRTATRACVFAGPSLAGYPALSGIDLLPPATRGALTTAVNAGYTRIGLIDGAIEHGRRLPLGELRQALARPGIEVLGAASMGAIRAVQLASSGMQGVGRVFRLLHRGSLTDDDEVYVLHAPAALRYRCLTLPLINIRYTLRLMRRTGHLVVADEQAIMQHLRDVPWFDRDRHSLSAAIYAACGRSRCARVIQAFDFLYRDVKREDALLLLSTLQNRRAAAPARWDEAARTSSSRSSRSWR